jgi:hypothetical protein
MICTAVLVVALLCAPSYAGRPTHPDAMRKTARWRDIFMKLLQSNNTNTTAAPNATTAAPTPSVTPMAPSVTPKPIKYHCGANNSCNGKGKCVRINDSSSTDIVYRCECNNNWERGPDGTCTKCVYGMYGSYCNISCVCGLGQLCDSGVEGTGKCSCGLGYSGPNCTKKCPTDEDDLPCGGWKYGMCDINGDCNCTMEAKKNNKTKACEKDTGRDPSTPAPTTAPTQATLYLTYDVDTFGLAQQDQFKTTIADICGISSGLVEILSISPASIKVDFKVKKGDGSGAVDVKALNKLQNALTDPTVGKQLQAKLGVDTTKPLAILPTAAPTPTTPKTPIAPKPSSASSVLATMVVVVATLVSTLLL